MSDLLFPLMHLRLRSMSASFHVSIHYFVSKQSPGFPIHMVLGGGVSSSPLYGRGCDDGGSKRWHLGEVAGCGPRSTGTLDAAGQAEVAQAGTTQLHTKQCLRVLHSLILRLLLACSPTPSLSGLPSSPPCFSSSSFQVTSAMPQDCNWPFRGNP